MVVTTLAIALPLGVVPAAMTATAEAAASSQLTWSTVANAADLAPGSIKNFNSFNQPSVNADGVVVFRARTKGESEPVRGVYTRDMAGGSAITPVAEVGGLVPQPNNSDATFNEFPAFPRIDTTGAMVATRGQSTPVLTYTLPDLSETKVGTSGVYATPGGVLTSGATLLGNLPEYALYAVPDAPADTRFDQFPGAPAVDGSTIVFKGNYTVGTTGLTGVYFRDLGTPDQPVKLIAGATTPIPGGDGTTFGSTAPPSAAAGKTVFTGWDNEATPTKGGIYLAPTSDTPSLTTVVAIGDQVPGQVPAEYFTNVGEGLSFDGRYVGFWASWGSETRTIVLTCPTDGNKDLVAFCNETYPNGYTTQVPVHQGVFVADTTTGVIKPVAASGSRFGGFQFWVFSGRPPGTGGGDEVTLEPARWRSSAFVALSSSGMTSGQYQVAFKAAPVAGGSGIYLTQGPGDDQPLVTVLDTTTAGTAVDPNAPAGSTVTAVGVERDGFRGRWLAINASMLDAATSESWAGIYLTTLPTQLARESQAITITSTPPTSPVPGGNYVITAVASSGLPVSFTIDATTTSDACTITGSTVHFAHIGTCVVDADQAGDATYLPAPQVKQTIAVAAIATTVSVALTASPISVGQETFAVVTVSAASGNPAGSVQFAVDGQPLGAPVLLTGGKATSTALVNHLGQPLVVGPHTVTATFTPSDTTVYAGSYGTATLVVTAVPVSATYKTDFTGVTLATVSDPTKWHMTGAYDAAVKTLPTGNSVLRISNAVTADSFGDMIYSPTLPVPAREAGPATTFTAKFDLLPVALQPGLRVTISPDDGSGDQAGFLTITHTSRGVDLAITGSYLDSAGKVRWTNVTVATGLNSQLTQSITMTITKKLDTKKDSNNDTFSVQLKGKPAKTTTFEAYYHYMKQPNYQTDTLLFRVSGTPVPSLAGAGMYFDNVSLATS
jgi:hypothetical protein